LAESRTICNHICAKLPQALADHRPDPPESHSTDAAIVGPDIIIQLIGNELEHDPADVRGSKRKSCIILDSIAMISHSQSLKSTCSGCLSGRKQATCLF
jgi:hypothetical protein